MIERGSRTAASKIALFALGALVLIASGACAAPTPLCDEGAGLIDSGRLDRGAEVYAMARHQGEGDCADTGLAVVGDRYTDAYVAVARGRAAENARDVEAAVAAYRAAVTIDVDNLAAREALERLQQPVPKLREPPPVAPPPATQPLSPWIVALIGAAVALLATMAGLLAWVGWRWRMHPEAHERADEQASERHAAVERDMRSVVGRLDKLVAGVHDMSTQVDGGLDGHRAALAELRGDLNRARRELAQVRSDVDQAAERRATDLEHHVDDVADALADLLSRGGEPSRERFVEPSG